MTISNILAKAGPFDGNDVTVAFPFTFKVFVKADVLVVRTDTGGVEADLVLDADYSVALNADQNATPGGTVTYPISGAPLATGEKLTLVSNVPDLQPTDITNAGGFFPQVVEDMSDRRTILSHQIKEALDRAMKFAVSDTSIDTTLPTAAQRADKFLGFDSLGNPIVATVGSGTIVFSPQTETFNGTGAQTAFVLASAPGSADALIVRISGVVQTPGVDYTIAGSTVNFVSAPAVGVNNVVIQNFGVAGVVGEPADGSVTALKLAGLAVTTAKLNDGAVTLPKLGIFTAIGDLLVGAAAGAAALLAKGTALQKLRVNAAGTALEWASESAPLSNRLINGNWLIDQIYEGTAKIISGTGMTAMDGWSGTAVGAGQFSMQQVADPDNAALKCLKIACTTADAAIAAGDAYYVFSAIEGYDVADLNSGLASAATVTLKFKAKFNVAGVYGVSVANSALNRSYTGIITVPDGNENEYTLTLTLDTAGAWLYTNGVGLYLRICLAAGTNFQKAAGAWGADNMLTTAAQVNFMSVNTNVGYIKRIQLVPGTVGLAYGPQDLQKELSKCQRYYWKSFPQGVVVAQNAGITGAVYRNALIAGAANNNLGEIAPFPVPMRATPTIVSYNPSAANAQWRDIISGDCSVVVFAASSRSIQSGTATGNAGTGVGNPWAIHLTADARLS